MVPKKWSGKNYMQKTLDFYSERLNMLLWRGKRLSRTHLLLSSRIWPSRWDSFANCSNMVFQIHNLPLSFYQKERTKRNRYLITEIVEQRRLLGTRFGFVGLSTASVALQQASLREGTGGIYHIRFQRLLLTRSLCPIVMADNGTAQHDWFADKII